METEKKASNDGMEGMESRGREAKVANPRRVRCSELLLRLMALALTLVAAIVVGVDKQTKIVPFTVVSTLPPLNVPVTAKWHYMSAFVYFVVSNAVACAYAALSLLHSIANKGGKTGMGIVIIILDLMMVALLLRQWSRSCRRPHWLRREFTRAVEQGVQRVREILSPCSCWHSPLYAWITSISLAGSACCFQPPQKI